VLVLFGTLDQAHESIYDVQKRYFDSIVASGGMLPFPMPGAYLLLSVLFVNLVVGTLLRLRRLKSRFGVLVVHAGIALLLAGGLVEFHFSDKGYLTLEEGEAGDRFVSYYEWEVAVAEARPGGARREHVIPHERIEPLGPGSTARFVSAELPFDVRLSSYLRNCRPREAPGGIEGFLLDELRPAKEAERNVAGIVAELLPKSGGPVRTTLLWGLQERPFVAEFDGRRFAIDLRKRTFPLPFRIVLHKCTHETHPRTGMASKYASDITRLEGGVAQDVHITMNEPMRHRGYTFYQSGMGGTGRNAAGRPFSTFAVVRNPADRVPLAALLVIAAGLLLEFVTKLLRYIRAEAKRRVPQAVAAMLLLTVTAEAAEGPGGAPAPSAPAWSDEALELAGRIPVQDEGRIKPLSTMASFSLLRIHHRRTARSASGGSMSPMEWYLEALLYPELAVDRPVFLVETYEVLDAIGVLREGKKKRDRYTFRELEAGRRKLMQLAAQYDAIDAKDRTPVQGHVVNLAHAFREMEAHLGAFAFARGTVDVSGDPAVAGLFAGRERAPFSDVVAKIPELAHLEEKGGEGTTAPVAFRVLSDAFALARSSDGLAFLPPMGTAKEEREWYTPLDLFHIAYSRRTAAPEHVAILAAAERMHAARGERGAFLAALADFYRGIAALAERRGEGGKVGLEVFYHRLGAFDRSLGLYVAAFLLVALGWAWPASRWLSRGAWALLLAGLGLHATGIILRCVLRSRPPVLVLYDTVIFVTGVAVLACLITERINRQRIGLALAPFLGALGLFLAWRYEEIERTDGMRPLIAVLDTNFWLMTHVTCITIGYSAALLASAVGHVHVLGRLFGVRRGDDAFYRNLGRMVYGMTCFALLFSVVGTILGGEWANQSWGRFWGWDPKENGALMIVLVQIAILHARLGGFLGPHGISMAAIFGGCVVAFSWWGVNLLGIGLHSYGFTQGIMNGLVAFYAVEGIVLLAGLFLWLRGRARGPAPTA